MTDHSAAIAKVKEELVKNPKATAGELAILSGLKVTTVMMIMRDKKR